jgi:signal transduction histidine kinase
MKLWGVLSRLRRMSMLLLGISLLVLVGTVDYLTGPEIAFSIFYLVPVSLLAWFFGRRVGIAASLTAAGMWLGADLLSGHGYSSPAIPYWNAAVRLGFFLIVSLALATLHDVQRHQEELGHFLVHDLRTPLTNVMAALQTLQVVAAKDDPGTVQDLVEMCMVSCQRMVMLTNSILDLGRLEEGKMSLQLELLDLRKVIAASLEQVGAWAKQSAVQLVLQVDAEAPTVYADADLTGRVLVNLLGNAIKASREGYQVTITATRGEPDMTVLRIADEGPGIPEAWADRVFEKYGQVEARKSGAAVGSGLGLTFCRLAVEAQGGRIWVEKGYSRGTRIAFTLPRQREQKQFGRWRVEEASKEGRCHAQHRLSCYRRDARGDGGPQSPPPTATST